MLASAYLAALAQRTAGVTLDPGNCLAWAFVGLIAGWLAGLVSRGRGFGCLGDLALGLFGAGLGALILNALLANGLELGLPPTLQFFGSLVVAFVGALLLAMLGRLLGGSGRRRRYEWRR